MSMRDSRWVLAIDFGTTNTVAVVQGVDDPPRVLQFGGSPLLRSAVYLDAQHTWEVGRVAEKRALEEPSRFEATPKRRIGDGMLFLGGQDIPVVDAIGAVLDTVVREAVRQQGGRPPTRVVLTHPALWGPSRTAVLSAAARWVLTAHVGEVELHLLLEPVAAAYHAATAAELPPECRVAVFDLGGGTLDVALLDRRQSSALAPSFTIAAAPQGLDPLGGEDFDTRLARWALGQVPDPAVGSRMTAPTSAADRAAAFELRRSAREAKEELSESSRAHVYVPRMVPQLPDGQSVQVGREQFEQLVTEDLERGTALLAEVIRTAPIGPPLAGVFLVGGCGRIPLLGRLLADATGHNPAEHGDPATAVAEGAARWLVHDLSPPPVLPSPTGGPISPGPTRPEPPTHPLPPVDKPSDGTPIPPNATGFSKFLCTIRSVPWPSAGFTALGHRRQALLAAAAVLMLAGLVIFLFVRATREPPPPSPPPTSTESPATAVPTTGPEVSIPALGAAIPVGNTPGFVAVSPNGRHAYVANRGPQVITVLDTAENQVTARIPIPTGPPQFLAFSVDGHTLYVTIYNDQRTIHAIDVIDTRSNTVTATIPQPARPFLPAVTPDGKRLYVPNHDIGEVSVIDTVSNKVISQVKVPANPHWVAFSRDGSRAYTADHESNLVSVIDTATLNVLASIPVGNSPHCVAVNLQRPVVAAVNYNADSVSVIDTTTLKVVATIPVGKNPSDITWAPDGRFAYVVNEGSNNVSVIDASTNQVTATLPTGDGPTSIAVLPNGRQAYVTNLNSGTVRVLELTG
jgi:YVTN family beta-propeller protein